MKKISLIAVLCVTAVVAMAQYFGGTSPTAFNKIPNNEGTTIVIPLLTTNLATASATTNLAAPTKAIEIPGGRDMGLLVQGWFSTTNASFQLDYQLSPDNVSWTWPPLALPTGVITSNTTAVLNKMLILSNSVTYPFRYFRVYSITVNGTNNCYVSNAVAVYKSNPQANNYSR